MCLDLLTSMAGRISDTIDLRKKLVVWDCPPRSSAEQSLPCRVWGQSKLDSAGSKDAFSPPGSQAVLWLLLTHALVFVFLAGSWSSIQKWTFQKLNSTEPSPSPPSFSQPIEWGRIRIAGHPLPWASRHLSIPTRACSGGSFTKSSSVVLC